MTQAEKDKRWNGAGMVNFDGSPCNPDWAKTHPDAAIKPDERAETVRILAKIYPIK